jgi:hypothetical protein
MPLITEQPDRAIAQEPGTGGPAPNAAASKLEQVAKELDCFIQDLKRERDSWYSQHQSSQIQNPQHQVTQHPCSQSQTGAGTVRIETQQEDEAKSINMDVTLLQTMLQEVENKLKLAQNDPPGEYNDPAAKRVSRRDTHDSGISDIGTSLNSRQNSLLSVSPKLQSHPGILTRRVSPGSSPGISGANFEGDRGSPSNEFSPSSMGSPFLGSSPATIRTDTGATTAATTPMFSSPTWEQETTRRPPSITLPSSAIDWGLFCNEAQVTCDGWQNPWSCSISQRRRMGDGGLSLRAEKSEGCFLYHDLPAPGIAIPHTSHTGADPQAKNRVTFKDPHGHRLRQVTGQGESREKGPKYIFQDPEVHKAFQELVYGYDLEDSWNIESIKSDREKESVTQTLRLWRDKRTRIPVIMFYTNKRKRSAATYIQEPSKSIALRRLYFALLILCPLETSFADKPKADKKKRTVQLNFQNQKNHDRVGSVSSGGSSIGDDRSIRNSTDKAPRLQWIEIEFADLEERKRFLNLWQGEGKCLQQPGLG